MSQSFLFLDSIFW